MWLVVHVCKQAQEMHLCFHSHILPEGQILYVTYKYERAPANNAIRYLETINFLQQLLLCM